MSTRGQFNTKNPTIKRILKEASELASQPSPDCHAEPLEDNLFEWHFTLRGPPAPSPYAAGIYHGRIVLPPQYPLRPPSFRFLTPTGRFEVNREICLSISGHHEETWQPAWGIRTALIAMRSFMDTDAKGQLGGLECDRAVRERMAREGAAWTCAACARSNGDILREREALCTDGEAGSKDDLVPEGLRLAYRDELGANADADARDTSKSKGKTRAVETGTAPAPSRAVTVQVNTPAPRPVRTVPAPQRRPLAQPSPHPSLAWIDICIYGVAAALAYMISKKWLV